MAKNKVKHGLSNVHIAFIEKIETGEDGIDKITYGDVIRVPGAVSLTTDPEGDEFKFYADNIVYYGKTSNNGYSAEASFAIVPDEVKIGAYGWIKDDNGVLVEVSDGKGKAMALMGQYEGDKEGGRFIYHNVTASRGGEEYNTDEEGNTVATESLSLMINPIKVKLGKDEGFIVKSTMDKSDNPEVYASFFTKPYVPTVTEGVKE